jgi:hypothetical protein
VLKIHKNFGKKSTNQTKQQTRSPGSQRCGTFGFQKKMLSRRPSFGTYTYTLTLKKACLNA